MNRKLVFALSAAAALGLAGPGRLGAAAESASWIESGRPWLDTDGNAIDAHSGGFLRVGDTYYWYGESHRLGLGNRVGITCYSSEDLYRWKNEGVVLPKEAVPAAYRDSGVVERPKVLFNAASGKFVMWMHLDAEGYTHACAGVAIADSPNGRFRFLRAFRPIAYDYGARMNDPRVLRFDERGKGNTYRDMTLFEDDDGRAYGIYSAEDNASIYICLLNGDYTDVARPSVLGSTWARAIPDGFREAPAMFKFGGRYYLITSGTTGWSPNAASCSVAGSILGPWRTVGNPCSGIGADTTFRSQGTYILPAPGRTDGSFIFMADRWVESALGTSSYVWIPFRIGPHGEAVLRYNGRWNLGIFDSDPALGSPGAIASPP
jgi:Glycosyl hydrolases family 43